MLTVETIETFVLPKNRVRYKLSDGKGLYVLVTATSKYWRYNYRYESKFQTAALGVYPDRSLDEARAIHKVLHDMVTLGAKPVEINSQIKSLSDNLLTNVIIERSNIKSIHDLEKEGVGFTVSVPSTQGEKTCFLTATELQEYFTDRLGLYAKKNGVTKSVYLEWMQADQTVFCSAMTTQGKKCKSVVKGGYKVNAVTFESMRGARCASH